MMFRMSVLAVIGAVAAGSVGAQASSFNGTDDNQIDSYGYYYEVGAAFSPNGQTRDSATGGTIQYITDSSYWSGAYGLTKDQWYKDGWYPATSSLALTMKNGAATVFDNNGIETNSEPTGFYDYSTNPGNTGAVVGYSMSNNYDWIYAGYFQLNVSTQVTSITGFFLVSNDVNSPAYGFDPNNPVFKFHTNIFSQTDNQFAANTGSFAGDVFSSDNTAGTYSWNDTGIQRLGSASTSEIYSLTYTLNAPVTLAGGDYYFSTDASIVPVPTAAWAGIGLLAGLGTVRMFRSRRSQIV